jgi:hypothetical protein
MLFVIACLAWLCSTTLVVALCRAAACGDNKLVYDRERPLTEMRRQSLPAYE